MRWLLIIWTLTVGGLSEQDVLLVNDTGLLIVRIEIGHRKFEGKEGIKQALVTVTPGKHHLKIVFVGGADVDWPAFDFRGVHEIIFERQQNKINARVE